MTDQNRREIACAIIIDTRECFLLQQRDNVSGILCPGMVALFGGHREADETFLQCVVREVHEEIGYFVAPERFLHVTTYSGVDADAKGGTVHGEFYLARDVPAETLHVTEGSLLVVKPDELILLKDRLAPSTRYALGAFLNLDYAG